MEKDESVSRLKFFDRFDRENHMRTFKMKTEQEVRLSFLVQDAMDIMEEIAPLHYAESWDPTGLQIGNPLARAERIVFALDATPDIVRRAIEAKAELLVVHHPMFFKPLKNLNLATPEGRIVEEIIRSGLAVYTAHTNLDSAPGGLNDALCRVLGLENPAVLAAEKEEDRLMLLLEIAEHEREGLDSFAQSMNCRFSWWQAAGGLWLGRVCVAGSRLAEMERGIRALSAPLDLNWLSAGKRSLGAGLGRTGILPEPLSLQDLALKLKEILGLSHIRVIGDEKKRIKRLAVCSGSGAGLIPAALARKADCLLTGDIKYHEAMMALDQGLCLLDAGHFGTEHLVVELLQQSFAERLAQKKIRHVHLMGFEGQDPFRVL